MVDVKKCSKEVCNYYKKYAHNKPYKLTKIHGCTFYLDEKY